MAAPAFAVALEASSLGVFMRASVIAYPLANLAHLLGLVLLVGPIIALDLRLLGFARALPVKALSSYLTPFAILGLLLMIASGTLLFSADAAALSVNAVLQIKVVLIALGLINAILFRLLWSGRLYDWDRRPAGFGRLQCAASIGLWLGAGTAGRLIAYF
ncbi:hypothetical protein ACFSM5_08765 [Lacibacterium aquatile]|uniref:DUF2214 domain-containing protein n=1 Tax=Lacibacterium aquatile TaxID=1168082 RepID=A0ABW5DR76_9PROT